MLGRLSGHQQIIMVNAHSVTGHDPLEGDILWEYPWRGDYAKVTQPVVIDANRVFVAAGYGIGCVMLKVERKEPGGWLVTELWKNRNLKPKFTNVVRKGDYVYGLDEGILTCVNLNDGRRVWKEGRYGHGQILEVGDLLLVQAERGDVVLVRISPQKPTELSRFAALQGKTWNNPVLVHDLLLVRNDQQAACYRLPLMTSQEL
jgi:outer membrane protein assembly factor BamB